MSVETIRESYTACGIKDQSSLNKHLKQIVETRTLPPVAEVEPMTAEEINSGEVLGIDPSENEPNDYSDFNYEDGHAQEKVQEIVHDRIDW